MDDPRPAIEGAIQTLAPALATSFSKVLEILGVSVHPVIPILFASTYGLFGYYLCYRQEEINAFATWIKEHPEEFAAHSVGQPAFQAGFMVVIEQYLKARDQQKRDLILEIFRGFAKSEDMAKFQLERLLDTATNISPEGIAYLRFISTEILPPLREHAKKEAARVGQADVFGHGSVDWWENQILTKNEPIIKRIKKWIHTEFDPNSPKARIQHGYEEKETNLRREMYDLKEPHERMLTEMSAEFLSLGIFHTIQGTSGTIGGGGSDEQAFTDFGWRVLEHLESGTFPL